MPPDQSQILPPSLQKLAELLKDIPVERLVVECADCRQFLPLKHYKIHKTPRGCRPAGRLEAPLTTERAAQVMDYTQEKA